MNETEAAATGFSFAALFYEEDSIGVFLLITVALGGGAAFLAGRAIAETWRPFWQIIVYSLILGAAARFLHFSLFDGTLLSAHYYAIDAVVCIAFGLLGFRVARTTQMVTQYRWINEPAGRLRWRRRPS